VSSHTPVAPKRRRSPVPIDLGPVRKHGTLSGYVGGCGCDPCRAAYNEWDGYGNKWRTGRIPDHMLALDVNCEYCFRPVPDHTTDQLFGGCIGLLTTATTAAHPSQSTAP